MGEGNKAGGGGAGAPRPCFLLPAPSFPSPTLTRKPPAASAVVASTPSADRSVINAGFRRGRRCGSHGNPVLHCSPGVLVARAERGWSCSRWPRWRPASSYSCSSWSSSRSTLALILAHKPRTVIWRGKGKGWRFVVVSRRGPDGASHHKRSCQGRPRLHPGQMWWHQTHSTSCAQLVQAAVRVD